MAEYDFDLLTIGAGSGGVAGSRSAAAFGARAAVMEQERVGGTCVLRGCVPKKLLVYGSHFADDLADAKGYGWTIGESTFDWPTLIANKNRELDRLNKIYLNMLNGSGVTLLEGRGEFIDAHTVAYGDKRVTADKIVIAVGSHPVAPTIPGIEHVISSNEALDLPILPKRLLIVGGGYIAVEFAGIFARFGVEVTLAVRGTGLLTDFDEDVRRDLAEEMTNRGIKIRTDTRILSIEKTGGGFCALTNTDEDIDVDLVMYATGRRPNVANLGLERVGITLGPKGEIPVDDYCETSVPGLYAVGDVTERHNLTPVAIAEARAISETLFNNNPTRFDRSMVPTAVFSQPPIGTCGLTEKEARALGRPLDIYRARFRPMKHTLSGRQERTMMKLIVDRGTDKVLGAHMLGTDAAEIIQGVAIAMKCGATKKQFDQTVAIHPTSAEEFVTMRQPVPERDTGH